MKRVMLVVAVLGLIATACGGGDSSPATTAAAASDEATTTTSSEAQPAQGVLPDGPSALDTSSAPEFPDPLVDPGEIISGGPPPDGIPPIEEPVFVPVTEALDLLDDPEAVVAIEIDGDARAYPVQVMIWHEIVNDTVGRVPVSVTYCPLCNSAVSYVREIRGVETTFGTSGRLFSSALVMYDRATESLWTHFDGRAVVGLLAGEQLEIVASPLLSWADFREAYPTGQVLDPTQTGFVRDYGRNPYVGYDDVNTDPFLFRGDVDSRAAAKQRVVGVDIDATPTAFALDAISGIDTAATNTKVGETDVVILWKAGQATALEDSSVEEGRDVGTVGVFKSEVDGDVLTFAAADGEVRDDQTGSLWSVTGEALDGPLAGTKLERVPHLDTFWFAWATYKPGTILVEAAE
ncbi:MAG: DUF3179 domain-containing protein [Acidimicrobiia bacterium]|nr:DUF3179 domain-containing protein [Acidimicrobiia bacterium]